MTGYVKIHDILDREEMAFYYVSVCCTRQRVDFCHEADIGGYKAVSEFVFFFV